AELGLDVEGLRAEGAKIFSGQALPEGACPIAQTYAGHQFGGFSYQLGDGRAMLMGEVVDVHGRRRDIQLKGSGPTPFSRGGDGLASVGPVLREYLISEALHAMGVSTTRMLAAVSTGTPVYRERAFPGAVVTRVAASHLRVGTFQFFAARQDMERVRQLADYAIARHYPEVADAPDKYVGLLRGVGAAQADLIAQWMLVGFIHGVMNTDNFTISGETIDFGPCAFMDAFDPRTVFSSIDHQGRYAFGNQPAIGQWNLARFAEAILPLLADEQDAAVEVAQEILGAFNERHETQWLQGMWRKLGLVDAADADPSLPAELLQVLKSHGLDYTSTMRALSRVARGEPSPGCASITDIAAFNTWAEGWLPLLDEQPGGRAGAAERMDAANPIYIPRNHRVEEALSSAIHSGDLEPFNQLLDALVRPFEEREGLERYAEPAPGVFSESYRTFCGT
ncbi:MAG: YdiU family protein, partial [Myxococcota bacterium]|nr:YdiU family protein [Myxococcota bacterium]